MSALHKYTKKELMTLITGKLRRNFGRDVEEATSLHMFKACALVLRDIMSERQMKTGWPWSTCARFTTCPWSF